MRRALSALLVLLVLVTAAGARTAWLRADPAVAEGVGVVWHDEGAWVHNARNRALWGVWRTDNWNPMFVAPVFTALEFGAFRLFGVGTWQARAVSSAAGLVTIGAAVLGLAVLSGRRAALVVGLLLATNYVLVMWNRAALMESTVVAFVTVSWCAYALTDRWPAAGFAAGLAAAAAWFTKASAAFFLAALILDLGFRLVAAARDRSRASQHSRVALWWTAAGLLVGLLIGGCWFVLPHWQEYYFYNWQMSVLRKPAYSLHALAERASWLPIVQRLFTRMWIEIAAGAVGAVAVARQWNTARPAERLLLLWLVVGMAELITHDSGNERRYVIFVPLFTILAARTFTVSRAAIPVEIVGASTRQRLMVAPLLLLLMYVVIGSALRPLFAADIASGQLHGIVRVSAVCALLSCAVVLTRWRGIVTAAAMAHRALPLAPLLVVLCVALDGYQFAAWARERNTLNYEASVALGRLLPAGTLVQGKLANGLALENRIRPLFVGNGFGNYADRFDRPDVRYILTYDLPQLGYESSNGSGLIQDILAHSPGWHVVTALDVDETPGPDRAVLIDKFPSGPQRGAGAQKLQPDARH